MRGIRIWGMGALLLGVSACGNLRISDDCACGYYTNAESGAMLHWEDGTKVSFALNASVPLSARPAIEAVTDEYNARLARSSIAVDTSVNTAPDIADGNPKSVSGDGINGIYWLNEPWPWADDKNHSDAMTVVLFSPDHIVEADIFFRAQSFNTPSNADFRAGPTPNYVTTFEATSAPHGVQLAYVLGLHEMGHAMGLVHRQDRHSIMFPVLDTSLFLTNPFGDVDLKTLQEAYALRPAATKTLAIGQLEL